MPITAAVLAVLVIMGLTALYLDIVRPVSAPSGEPNRRISARS